MNNHMCAQTSGPTHCVSFIALHTLDIMPSEPLEPKPWPVNSRFWPAGAMPPPVYLDWPAQRRWWPAGFAFNMENCHICDVILYKMGERGEKWIMMNWLCNEMFMEFTVTDEETQSAVAQLDEEGWVQVAWSYGEEPLVPLAFRYLAWP